MAVLWALAGAASAQTATDVERDAAQQRRAQEREAAQAQRLQAAPDVHLPRGDARPDRRLADGESPCFAIRSVAIEGWPLASSSELERALRGPAGDDAPQGRCLGAQGVDVLLQRVQNELVARGFVTSRVLAKPQDLSRGELVLTVMPGRVREVLVTGDTVSALGLRAAVPMTRGDLLNLRDVEQALENFKRLPSTEADIELRPGAQPGESDVVIKLQRARPWHVQASLDDGGSKATGRYQGSLTLSYDNPLGLNDMFYVALNEGLAPHGGKGTAGRNLHYSLPYGYWLLALNAGQNRYHQRVAGLTQDYVYSGESASADLKLSRLIYRDATQKTTVSAKAFWRQSRNYIDDTEVEVQHRLVGGWEAGLSHRWAATAGTLDASLSYKRGTGAFRSLPAPEEDFGEGSSRAGLALADLSWSGSFQAAGRGWRYASAWRAQLNRGPLTPQDRFAIGGRYSVRGFDGERSLSADRGWTWRNELGTPIPEWAAEVYLALDTGRVGGSSARTLPGRQLAGAALGLRGGQPGKLQFDCTLGHALHAPTGFGGAGVVSTFSLTQSW